MTPDKTGLRLDIKCVLLWAALLAGFVRVSGAQAQGPGDEGLSYSPEHWPSRWSSAVRQKQGSVFPQRDAERAIGDGDDFVTEDDLFARPGQSGAWDELGESEAWQRLHSFDDRKFRKRRERRRQRGVRTSPYGFPGGYGPPQRTMYPAPYSGAGPMTWDPVLGYGSVGYPPVGMPIVNYPYLGFPLVGGAYPSYLGGPGSLNYPFGPW